MHGPNDMMNCNLGDLLPHLDQGITELLHNLRCELAARIGPKITSQRCSTGFRSIDLNASMDLPPQTVTDPPPKPVILKNVTGSVMFSTASPESFTHVT